MTAPWNRPDLVRHAGDLARSFRTFVGRDLAPPGEPLELAERLFGAPFALVSHGVEVDPVLNYGNATALALWEMDFADFTRTPSRVTAEPPLREARARLLAAVAEKGFIDHYAGVRIAASGRRFHIENVVVWTVVGSDGAPRGQAAMFDQWTFL